MNGRSRHPASHDTRTSVFVVQLLTQVQGRTISKTVTLSNHNHPGHTTHYQYNLGDQVTHITYPSGLLIQYHYGNHGRVQSITATLPGQTATTLVDHINYLPFGPLTTMAYGNGLNLSASYNQDYRLTELALGPLLHLSYQYDANGNITVLDHHHQATNHQTFGYDALDRLINSRGDYGLLDYLYDPVGNRRSRTQATDENDQLSYAVDSNQLLVVDSTQTSHYFNLDERGNPIAETRGGDHWTYTYNHANRLSQVSINGHSTHYRYNAQGQRTHKQSPSGDTYYLYNEQGQLQSELDAQGNTLVEYVWFNQQPLAQVSNGEIYWVHNDHLGTPRALTNRAQEVVWEATYSPFGEARITTEVLTNNLRFPGQYFDGDQLTLQLV